MLKFLDDFLNGITMYRLVLYILIIFVLAAIAYCAVGILPFSPVKLILSVALIVLVSFFTNAIFSKIFKVAVNSESIYITALILSLIITPINSFSDITFSVAAGFLAAASKFVVIYQKKHVFNPAAFGVLISSLILGDYASWWVGNPEMVPIVIIGGLLILKKIKKWSMVCSFFLVFLSVTVGRNIFETSFLTIFQRTFLQTSALFFAFVMLTEPQTTPPARKRQILYGGLIGLLFALPLRFLSFYLTPEAVLVAGNIFSFAISPKGKFILKLKEKIRLDGDIFDFIFVTDGRIKLNFLAGQYLEWTLPHKNPDSRGERRYFTIAASPTEDSLRIGVRFFFQKSSSFKKALFNLKPGASVSAGLPAGEFTLPPGEQEKLCFIAGGIGITPFRSMLKFLIDTRNKRDIILLYGVKNLSDFVYGDILKQAAKVLKTKIVYISTEKQKALKFTKVTVGYIDSKLIRQEVPDFRERIFYISGPHSMVDNIATILSKMKIPNRQIKDDFFPGYA